MRDSTHGTPGTSGRAPRVPSTTHDDSALARAKANLIESERRLPSVESRYNQCQDAYLDAETELDALKARITQRRAELTALAGE